MEAKNRVFDLIGQKCRNFDSTLSSLESIIAKNEKYFENISALSKRLSLETTVTQEEAIYYLSCNLKAVSFDSI